MDDKSFWELLEEYEAEYTVIKKLLDDRIAELIKLRNRPGVSDEEKAELDERLDRLQGKYIDYLD